MKRPKHYHGPMLTKYHFTAEHALAASRSGMQSASGLCTPKLPWGGQCTRLLKDGTPVDNAFVRAVLAHLAGEPDAARDYLAKWNERVRKICESTNWETFHSFDWNPRKADDWPPEGWTPYECRGR